MTAAQALALASELALASPGADAWRRAELGGVRGVTIGPIENGYHPSVGYASPAYERCLNEIRGLGATWVALTPFGRVPDLRGSGIDPTFEVPFDRNRVDVARAIEMAHARGFHVMLVPHLWVESGQWRGELEPGSEDAWARWADRYERFVRVWAEVAQETHADVFSAGVELRSWVTTAHAPSFSRVIREIRRVYHGLVTYSANWDDVDQTVIWGDLDLIGINAFYPLTEQPGASYEALLENGRKIRTRVHDLAESWQKPVLFTETGYTTRADPALRPWVWPDSMSGVAVDEGAQATAYRALTVSLLDDPDFAGFFVWRLYADPDDTSQEAPWGFSPRGKQAEIIVRDAFASHWTSDPWWRWPWPERSGAAGTYP
jgi:hypothetical protein